MILTRQFDKASPTFFDSTVELGVTKDKTDWINIWSFKERSFFGLELGQAQPSAWIEYP